MIDSTLDPGTNVSSRLLPSLPPDLERRFEADYFVRIRLTLRLMTPFLAALFAVCAARDYTDTGSLSLAMSQDGAPAVLFLAAFALTWVKVFGRFWQPVLTAAGLATALMSLQAMGAFLDGIGGIHHAPSLGNGPPGGGLPAGGPPGGAPLLYALQVCLLMICLTVLRLRLRWMLVLQSGVFGIGVLVFVTHLAGGHAPSGGLLNFLRPVVAILAAVLLAALVSEQLAVRAFIAGCLLEEERNGERRQREQTEGKLRVLAQAIGGIVHDLGNPLTVVQMGADLLEMQADSGDAEAIRETNAMVREGAEMLAALRLSLIEQTRVLEGKPIPVELRPEPLRPIAEAGARLQNPRFLHKRTISLDGADLELCADRLRLITVFMNLIGNALKYSSAEVRVVWRTVGETALVGVLDQGASGKGLSEAQARQLFVAFGRLDAHAAVEGTGLGLVSARKIVEAHGGEIYIEGYEDGTLTSPPFSTSAGSYPSLLPPGFLSGFVVVCPSLPTADVGRTVDTADVR